MRVETRPRSWLTSSGVASYRLHQSPGARHPAMFCGPSWDNHFCVPLCPNRTEVRLEPRRAKGRSSLPAPLPASPDRARKLSPLPAGGDRFSSHLPRPSCCCQLPGEAGTVAPITRGQCTASRVAQSEKYVLKPVDNGDIGNNRRNFVTNAAFDSDRAPLIPAFSFPDSARTRASDRATPSVGVSALRTR